MNDLYSLEQKLAANLSWHRSRIKFLARLMSALVTTRSVNLTELAGVFAGRAQISSHYKRCQRFLKKFKLPYAESAHFVIPILGQESGWTLALDRTNWKLGKAELNLLILAMVHRGTAYPFFWFPLDKAGNSHTDERILILELFFGLFQKEQVATLVAAREFIGKTWLEWLKGQEIPFQIRVKESFQVTRRGRRMARKELFRSATPEHPLLLKRACWMWGERYYFSGSRLATGEYLILVSPTYEPEALGNYANRWGIETLFGNLKTRGFNLEATHVTKEDRLQKLVALLALTFCWCHQIGLWMDEQKPLTRKKHGRLPQSHFRRGLDCLRRLLVQGTNTDLLLWQKLLHLLSCT